MLIEFDGYQLEVTEEENNLLVCNEQNGKSHYLLNTQLPKTDFEVETIFIASLEILQ